MDVKRRISYLQNVKFSLDSFHGHLQNRHLCRWASDRGGERATLDIGTGEVPVLSTSAIVTLAG